MCSNPRAYYEEGIAQLERMIEAFKPLVDHLTHSPDACEITKIRMGLVMLQVSKTIPLMRSALETFRENHDAGESLSLAPSRSFEEVYAHGEELEAAGIALLQRMVSERN